MVAVLALAGAVVPAVVLLAVVFVALSLEGRD